jgi:hypothetical protein
VGSRLPATVERCRKQHGDRRSDVCGDCPMTSSRGRSCATASRSTSRWAAGIVCRRIVVLSRTSGAGPRLSFEHARTRQRGSPARLRSVPSQRR